MHERERGVTLIELLVSIAILGFLLAGIYGMLNTAYQSFLDTRRRIDSQQTARMVTNYLVYRLREIDGGQSTSEPWNCQKCHQAGRAVMPVATSMIPCPQDVTLPRRMLDYTLAAQTTTDIGALPWATLRLNSADFPAMTGNKITYQADMLPLFGFSETFTDTNGNSDWDWTANNEKYDFNPRNWAYDYGEVELLEDLNENSKRDVFSENWSLRLKKVDPNDKFYSLVESVDFSSLRPKRSTDATMTVNGKHRYNRSPYDDAGYTDQIVATGLLRMNIVPVPRVSAPAAWDTTHKYEVPRRCQDPTSSKNCHGSSAGNLNVYGDAKDFNMAQFVAKHPFWNIRGFNVQVSAGAFKVGKTKVTTLEQFVIPRNLEINRK